MFFNITEYNIKNVLIWDINTQSYIHWYQN